MVKMNSVAATQNASLPRGKLCCVASVKCWAHEALLAHDYKSFISGREAINPFLPIINDRYGKFQLEYV